MSRYIDEHRGRFGVEPICRVLDVSASAYYLRATGQRSSRVVEDERLLGLIEQTCERNYGAYGYRKTWLALRRQGVQVGRDRVRRLMRAHGLQGAKRRGKPWRTTIADPRARRPPDLVDRDFTAEAPGQKLVGDITYIPTWDGWLYLATVIDCCTKACIGYAMADHMRAELVTDALEMAARNYTLADGAIFHSDRGTQYMSVAFGEATERLGVRRSVGRTGVCFDNALAESFNAALKVERVNRTAYPTREHARADIARYIEFRYNSKRLHSALGYRTPQEAHDEYLNGQLAA